MKKLLGVLVLSAAICGVSTVYAGEVDVELLGAATYGLTSTGTPSPSAQFGLPGGGAVLDMNFGSHFGIGLGAYYLTRTYNNPSAQTTNMIEGTLAANIWITRWLGLELGGYYNYFLNTPQNIQNGKDFGGLAGLKLDIPVGAKFGIILGGQYHYALSNLTFGPPAGNITPHEILAQVGFRIGMHGGK